MQGDWIHLADFLQFNTRETTDFLFAILHIVLSEKRSTQKGKNWLPLSEKGSTLKGKNLLHGEQILSF